MPARDMRPVRKTLFGVTFMAFRCVEFSIVFAIVMTDKHQPHGLAAYGGIYVAVALAWLWLIDAVRPDRWDFLGVVVSIVGMAIIFFPPRG